MGVSYEQSEVFGLDNVEAFEQPDDIECHPYETYSFYMD